MSFFKESNNREVIQFLSYLKRLEVIEAVGVARLLGVQLVVEGEDKDKSKPKIKEKEYDIILSEIIDAFIAASRSKRKMIMNTLKAAVNGK